VLRRLGVDVDFPEEQTCCGQPMANSGCAEYTRPLAERFLKIFGKYDYVVAPSGSCVSMVRNHYAQWLEGRPDFDHLRSTTFELCEYLVDIARVVKVDGDFPCKVGLHMSCHGLRELRLGRSSEVMVKPFNEEAVSCLMGRDRIADHEKAGAEIIAGFDTSCLMHLDGLIRRESKPLRVMHVAEILERARLS
jgi:L-lactate dehydrogenase complex protein LldE